MVIVQTVSALQAELTRNQPGVPATTGFVPTMGALHNGHLSLIRESRNHNGKTVCSIFVNPAQFNNQEDLKHYPRPIEADIKLLEENGCDLLFAPSMPEIYPDDFVFQHFDLGYLESILEGEFRPGHFQGVCNVVSRLLDLVHPDKLYLGQKDYQQCMVLARLLEIRNNPDDPNIFIQPTLREPSGLAMSSRNLRLSSEERDKASEIFRQLENTKQQFPFESIEHLEARAKAQLQEQGFEPDYYSILNAGTLLPLKSKNEPTVALVAAGLGKVRLIDNMLLY